MFEFHPELGLLAERLACFPRTSSILNARSFDADQFEP